MAYRSIEDSRHESYKYFPVKKPVKLFFETDSKTVYTIGYPEENDPGIFSDAEETQISIICPDPWFYALSERTVILSGIEGMFEFPFSNESLTQKLIIFGEVKENNVETFTYEGEVEVGFVAELEVMSYPDAPKKGTHYIKRIRIINILREEILTIDTDILKEITGDVIQYGDLIQISTVPGDKYAKLIRYGVEYDILNSVVRTSVWPKVYPGENTFGFVADQGMEYLWFRMTYRAAYQGI